LDPTHAEMRAKEATPESLSPYLRDAVEKDAVAL
jgi:hypothetical protein